MLLSRGLRRRSEDGAAAVEFALVTPLLFLVMFGILQYGLYFFDTLGTRQGVREAARQGVVENFVGHGLHGQQLAKSSRVRPRARSAPSPLRTPGSGWWPRAAGPKASHSLVCAQHKSNGGVGLLPMP